MTTVTVGIPTLNGARVLEETLTAVRAQRLAFGVSLELLICDSGSNDRSVSIARHHGATLIEIAPGRFSHGGTRNLLMERAQGDRVAFLTQDAVPADDQWLARLLDGFSLAGDVGLVFGPYRPRAGASLSVARELNSWFASFSEGEPRIDALSSADRDAPPRHFFGHLGFFTDANGCVARAAWEQVPFRPVAYAEDHMLAQDMLRAGFAKVYVPDAAVIHSHEYSSAQWLRRSFDEARAVRDVYGWVADPRALVRNLRGNVMADLRWARRGSQPGWDGHVPSHLSLVAAAVSYHGARMAGELLGARAGRLPAPLVRRLSLEGRA